MSKSEEESKSRRLCRQEKRFRFKKKLLRQNAADSPSAVISKDVANYEKWQ
ncbi:MAG: hypothetical protein ACTTJ2_06320 [Anaerovoracaceae bacterium]